MSSQPSEFRADQFQEAFRQRLKAGKEALDYLLDAYLWAQANWKEIRKFSSDFTREKMREEFISVFHFDPASYIATARKFGGGTSQSRFELGKCFIECLGVPDAIAAARKLNEDEAESLARRMVGADRKAILKEVTAIAEAKANGGERHGVSWKARCIELERENAALRAEVDILRNLVTGKPIGSAR